jgi:hypothetical protein
MGEIVSGCGSEIGEISGVPRLGWCGILEAHAGVSAGKPMTKWILTISSLDFMKRGLPQYCSKFLNSCRVSEVNFLHI